MKRGRLNRRTTRPCLLAIHAACNHRVDEKNLGHLRGGSRRIHLHRKAFKATQHIVVMARGFSGELDRFDLTHQGAENRFPFEPSDCLADAAVNACP